MGLSRNVDDLYQETIVVDGETIVINEADTEYVGIIIKDEEVPKGYEEDHCVVHSIMIILTVAFAAFNVVRVIQRSRENAKERTVAEN